MIFKKLWDSIKSMKFKFKLILVAMSLPIFLSWITITAEYITAKSDLLPILGCGSLIVLLFCAYTLVKWLLNPIN